MSGRGFELSLRLLGLQALMLSCVCGQGAQDESQGGSEHVTPAFVLDFSGGHHRVSATTDAEAETELSGDGVWLRIRNDVSMQESGPDGGLAVLVYTGNSSGEWWNPRPSPPGLFYRHLDAMEVERLHRAVRWSPWWLQPPWRGRGHHQPIFGVLYSSADGFSINREINPSDAPFGESAAELYRSLETLEDTMWSKTSRKVSTTSATLEFQVWAERSSADDPFQYVLWVQFQNHGTHPVVFADPRILRPLDPSSREYPYIFKYDDEDPYAPLRIQVTELDDEGWPPWVLNVPLAPLICDDSMSILPRNVVLDGQSTFEIEVPWVAPGPGRYSLGVKWKDFEGPIVAVEGQLSFMPLARRGPSSLGTGPYPVRGAYVASHIIEVPDR